MIDNVHRKPLCAYYQKTLGDLEYKKRKSRTQDSLSNLFYDLYYIYNEMEHMYVYIHYTTKGITCSQQKELHS